MAGAAVRRAGLLLLLACAPAQAQQPPDSLILHLKTAEVQSLVEALARVPCSGTVKDWIACSQIAQLVGDIQKQAREQMGGGNAQAHPQR